jgi:hypothetical protein
VSQRIDAAVYLLNPIVKTPTGEWEAWFLGDALPGAYRQVVSSNDGRTATNDYGRSVRKEK